MVPWRRVFTTNYDDVFENACSAVGKRVDVIGPLDDSSRISKKSFASVHLNGSIRRVDSASIWNDLKLTQQSYDSGSAMEGEWGALFRADLQAAQAVFFVGYSLGDLDIRRLLFEEQLKDKSFFVLGVNPSMDTAHRASKYGLLVAAGVEEFAEQIRQAKSVFVPDENPTPLNFSLTPYEFDVLPSSLEDRNVFDLLLFGRIRPELIGATYLGQFNYCCPREAVDLALDRIEHGTKIVVLHSALGNGKTVALECLKYVTHAANRSVYTLSNRGENLAEELQTSLLGSTRPVFFIDNYVEWLDVLPMFGAHQSEQFTLVVSARSSSHDLLIDRLVKEVGSDDLFEIGIDRISEVEADCLVEYFDEFGLWGEEATQSKHRKTRQLLNVCEGEWRAILLKLLESPNIIAKLQALFGALKKEGVYRDPLVRLLVLAVLAYRPATSLLVHLCGDKVLEAGFRKDQVAHELVEFSSTSVGIRSSVTAEALLKQIVDPNLSIQAVIGMLRRADTLPHSPYNSELFKSLIRFSNLHLVLPEKDRGRAGMRIYEAVKHLNNCKQSPLFWLQYAIASLVAQNFERAKAYFDNAYAFANQMYAYETHQIDNHYARFLVERAMHLKNPGDAMSAFREARVLIYSQLTSDRRHYPFRVAAGWSAFYAFFREALGEAELLEIRNAAEYVNDRIDTLPADRSSHRSVVECKKAMESILKDFRKLDAQST